MAYIWAILFILGTGTVLASSGGGEALSAMMAGAGEAVTLCIELAGAYLLFCGLLGVMKKAGLMESLSRRLEKPVSYICPRAGKAAGAISMALAANILGLGNAATPLGIAAMKQLAEGRAAPENPSFDMCAFLAVNASALQLLPTGVIAIRQASGSASPAAIVLPSLVATGAGACTAVALVRLLWRRERRKGP